MQAIMLAAGKGSRLGKYTKNNTKCMLDVHGETLLERAIDALLEAGIKDFILVLGYKKDNVKKFIKENSKEEPKAENIYLNIIYEDKYLIIINKPNNMSVHCSASEMSGTLVNGLLYHIKDFDFTGNKNRAGIIHRLDKDTSGLIIIGKNANIVSSIQEQFKKRTIKKIYHAILVGILKENFLEINLPIGRHSLYRKKMTVREDGKV